MDRLSLERKLGDAKHPPPWIRPWGAATVRAWGQDDILSDQRNLDLAVAAVNALPDLLAIAEAALAAAPPPSEGHPDARSRIAAETMFYFGPHPATEEPQWLQHDGAGSAWEPEPEVRQLLETVDRLTAHPDSSEAGLDHIAWAQHVRAAHEATHGEAEMCGAECIVLGLAETEDELQAELDAALDAEIDAEDTLEALWAAVVALTPKGWLFHGVQIADNSMEGGDWGPDWWATMSWPGHCRYDDCDHDDAFRIGKGATPVAALRSLIDDFAWTALPQPYEDRVYANPRQKDAAR